MSNGSHHDSLARQTPDYVAAAANAILGVAPFVGSLLAEIVGSLIPNQRVDRLADFARALEERLSGFEHEYVESQLSDEEFTDLVEESIRQVARATTAGRREQIASIVANSLDAEGISSAESKHLLRILGELNDIEVIRLGAHRYAAGGRGSEYRERHAEVLEPVTPHHGSSSEELDKAALQASYDSHLARQGLIRSRYEAGFNSETGRRKRLGYEITRLGELLLRVIDLADCESGEPAD